MRERVPPPVKNPPPSVRRGLKRRSLGEAALWLAFAALFLIASLRLGVGELRSPGPGFIPLWTGIGLTFCAGLLAAFDPDPDPRTARRERGAGETTRFGRIALFAGLAAYCLTLERIGYLPATFGLMLLLFSLGRWKPWAAVAGSLVAAVSSYGLFAALLRVPLPRGIFGF